MMQQGATAVTLESNPQLEPRATYATAARLDPPVGRVSITDLPEDTDSSRRAILRKLELFSLKSHFFSRTYCFPRRASDPD